MSDDPITSQASDSAGPDTLGGRTHGVPRPSRQADEVPCAAALKSWLVAAGLSVLVILAGLGVAAWGVTTLVRAVPQETPGADVPYVSDYAGGLGSDSVTETDGGSDGGSAETSGEAALADVTPDSWREVVWAGWTGVGRFAVVEYVDAGEKLKPTDVKISVRDTVSGVVTGMSGYHIVVAEPQAARLWLTPANDWVVSGQPASSYPALNDLPDDHNDAKHGGLSTWEPDQNAPKRLGGWSAPWLPVAGPNGVVAHMTVDLALGSWPAHLSFTSPTGGDVIAMLPFERRAYEPLGFSRSGAYFAVRDTHGGDLSRCVIVSTRTGAVVSDVRSDEVTDYSSAAWDGASDALILYGTDNTLAEDDPPFRAWRLKPGGKALASSWKLPTVGWSFSDATGAEVGQPTLIAKDELRTLAVYRLSWKGAQRVKVVGPAVDIVSPSPDGGMLLAVSGGSRDVAFLAAGAPKVTTVWRSDEGWAK